MRNLFSLLLFISLIKADEILPLHLLPHDCIVGQKNATSHGNHGRGMKTAMYQLVGFTGAMKADIKYHLSNQEVKSLKMNANMINLPRSMYDNYHALVANVESKNDIYTSVYYIYKHGRPSKTSPTKLTFKEKGFLEIIPNNLPREHDRYQGSKRYSFILKLNGKTVQNQTIKLTTLNKTIQNITTNKDGEFSVVLPNDFKNVKDGRRVNRPSYFILSSSINKDGKNYHTTFSNPYYVNPTNYWSSVPAGFGVAGLGLLIGLLILSRRKNG